jgi:molecular chaperone GrpE
MADHKGNADEKKRAEQANAAESSRTAAEEKENRVAELEEELKKKSAEAAASHDRYLRAVADGENLRKRLQREKSEAIRFANENLLRDLLQVVDSLELALEHAELGDNGKPVLEGVELTLRLFRDVLERYGVKEIGDPTGAAFDPATQEASEVEPSRAVPPNTVIRRQSKGYLYNDRLLRPARVVVARAPDSGENEESGEKESLH